MSALFSHSHHTASPPEEPDRASVQERKRSIYSEDGTGRRTCWSYMKHVGRVLKRRIKWKHFSPVVIISTYTLIGGLIFVAIEKSNDIQSREDHLITLERTRNETVDLLLKVLNSDQFNISIVPEDYVRSTLDVHEKNIGFEFDVETGWTFWNSMLYVGTIYTTIGYGHISCATFTGQIVTILYAIIGIPLVLSTLNDIGDMLLNLIRSGSNSIIYLHSHIRKCWVWLKSLRRPAVVPAGLLLFDDNGDITQETVSLPEVDEIKRDPTSFHDPSGDSDNPPVLACVFVTVGWLFFSAGFFTIWEDWDYWTSFYFFFISFSTIGFGDVTPEHPEFMMMNFGLVLIGLALVSVCINVIQTKIESLYFLLLQSILSEYTKMLETGSDQMGASLGMMEVWNANKAAKYLMPLLSKEKKQIVMQKFQEEAKAQGIVLPAVFTDVDDKSGMPSIFASQSATDQEQFLEHYYDEHEDLHAEIGVQVVPDNKDVFTGVDMDLLSPKKEMLVQTSLDRYKELCETDSQTIVSFFDLVDNYVQTKLQEGLVECAIQTDFSLYQTLREAATQSLEQLFDEVRCQTDMSYLNLREESAQTNYFVTDTSSQTLQKGLTDTTEKDSQTMRTQIITAVTQTDSEQVDSWSQDWLDTDDEHTQLAFGDIPGFLDEKKVQTDQKEFTEQWMQTEPRPKKVRVTEVASTSPEEIVEESEPEDDEEEDDGKNLTWNPFDGRHVEKQRSVSSLLKRFEQSKKEEARKKAAMAALALPPKGPPPPKVSVTSRWGVKSKAADKKSDPKNLITRRETD